MTFGILYIYVYLLSLVLFVLFVFFLFIGMVAVPGVFSVFVGGLLVVRVGDVGMILTCGMIVSLFELVLGSSNTFFVGSWVVRIGIDM